MLKTHAELAVRGQDGTLFKSKAAIRRALVDAPGFVVWTEVGTVANGFRDRELTTPELIAEINGSALVVGPDPYRLRNYFGTVTVKAGKLVVK